MRHDEDSRAEDTGRDTDRDTITDDQPGERRRSSENGRTDGRGGTSTDRSARRESRQRQIPADEAARRAAQEVAALTGREPESVISIDRSDGTWKIGIEVVEMRRIPDSADILATYEVTLEPDGSLLTYHRVRRYARGQMDRDC